MLWLWCLSVKAFHLIAADFIQLKTAALYYEGNKLFRVSDATLSFKVQAAQDANIYMFEGSDYSKQAYHLVIGGRDNTITYIKK